MEPPRHRAFFVIWRLAGDPDPEPEALGNPHKQRKKQRKQDSARGARGWARMDARLYWVCGESSGLGISASAVDDVVDGGLL